MGPPGPCLSMARSTDRSAGPARRARPLPHHPDTASGHVRSGDSAQRVGRTSSRRDASASATGGDGTGPARDCRDRRSRDQASGASRCTPKWCRCCSVYRRSTDACSRARWPAAGTSGARGDRCETFRRTLVGCARRALPNGVRSLGVAQRFGPVQRGLDVLRSRPRCAGGGTGRPRTGRRSPGAARAGSSHSRRRTRARRGSRSAA